jgi:hypothetical protein
MLINFFMPYLTPMVVSTKVWGKQHNSPLQEWLKTFVLVGVPTTSGAVRRHGRGYRMSDDSRCKLVEFAGTVHNDEVVNLPNRLAVLEDWEEELAGGPSAGIPTKREIF